MSLQSQNLRRIYTSQIGVREKTGKNDGPEVEKYLRYVGLGPGNAWCAALVSWTFGQAGFDQPKTAWSPALFPDKRVVWARKQQKPDGAMPGLITYNLQRTTPLSGDVFGIYFSELKRIAHCGFVDEWDGKWCTTVEGNTNDAGSVGTNGNPANPIRAGPDEGVYRKKRLIKTIYKVTDWVSH